MKIEIESVAKDAPRKVVVTPDEGEPFSFTAPNLAAAHHLLRAGRRNGWDTLRLAKK